MTRVSASQNIRIQPNRDLRLENFPSLSRSSTQQNSDLSSSKPGWVKKDAVKSSKISSVKNSVDTKHINPPVDEYPTLVSSPSYEPRSVAATWVSKDKTSVSGGKSTIVVPKVESEQAKLLNKKKKNSAKATNSKASNEALLHPSEIKKKNSDFIMNELDYLNQPAEISKASLQTQFRKTKLDDISSALSNTEPKSGIGSKITIIKPDAVSKPPENNGAKPKSKVKSINLSQSDFPSLGISTTTVNSFFNSSVNERSHQARVDKTVPSKNTNNAEQKLPVVLNNNVNQNFLPPSDFNERNQQLISTVMDLLCNQSKKIQQFRTISAQFRSGQLDPREYYMVETI